MERNGEGRTSSENVRWRKLSRGWWWMRKERRLFAERTKILTHLFIMDHSKMSAACRKCIWSVSHCTHFVYTCNSNFNSFFSVKNHRHPAGKIRINMKSRIFTVSWISVDLLYMRDIIEAFVKRFEKTICSKNNNYISINQRLSTG